ncbi:MAG TPA: hypothetical protein VFG87_10910 [Amycolatopsis sp.]|nr:hypothetical protein [Amycolatopsis sp.]
MTTAMGDNYGIVNSGSGSINADAMAAGRGARAVSGGGSAQLQDLQTQVSALLAALREAGGSGEIDGDVVETGELVEQELGKERPNKRTILGLLQGIASGVTQVAHLATAVTDIQAAVSALF